MRPNQSGFIRGTFLFLSGLLALGLSGCGGLQSTAPASTATVTLGAISGHLHGGQQPVTGSRVYLYAATSTGYGNQAQSLLTTTGGYVLTDANGNFTITGDYTCPSNSQVYVVGATGNPGLPTPIGGSAPSNASLALVAALGPCANLTASTNVNIDEVTTAAAAYALAGFATSVSQVSSSAQNASGMARAFAMTGNLASLATGQALLTTPAGNGTAPQAEINTLADIIAPCVNSSGTDGTCATLFQDATPSGGTQPGDTFAALLSIAHHPASNVGNLFALSAANAPFQPSLANAPNDWTVAISYTASAPQYGVAVDGSGNAWFSYHTGSTSGGTVAKYSSLGALLATYQLGPNGVTPDGIALDTNGNAYTACFDSNTLSRISSTGAISQLSAINSNGLPDLGNPIDVAVDGNNTVFVASFATNNVTAFTSSGTLLFATTPVTGATPGSAGILKPRGIAVDNNGAIWTANAGDGNATPNSLSKLSATGTAISTSTGFTGGGLASPQSIAFDASSTAWAPDAQTTVSHFANGGSPSSVTGYTGGGSQLQYGIAIDGSGNIFVSDNNQLKELNNAGTAITTSTGFVGGKMAQGNRLSLDQSGNLWVAYLAFGSTAVTEFIGIGTPTLLPLAAAVAGGYLGKQY